jgi:ATP-dependent protease ClpP protease subunit
MKIAFNKKNDTTEIDIFGDIGDSFFSEGNTLETVKAQFAGVDTPNTVVNVATFGGNVDDGFQIHDFVKSIKGNVTVKIVGWTASMGTIIALAGDSVEISENAMFLIHNAWNGVVGNAKELREQADTLDKVDNRLVSVYTDKTGLPPEDIRDLMEEEKWIDAEEAKELGFVDTVNEPIKAAASISNKELTKAGLPTIPEHITNKFKEMSETTTAVEETNEVSKLTEAFNSLKDTVVNFTEKFASKPEEVKILDNDEVIAKITEFEALIKTDAEHVAAAEVLSAKVTELEAKLASANASETTLATTEEPTIEGTTIVDPNAGILGAYASGDMGR